MGKRGQAQEGHAQAEASPEVDGGHWRHSHVGGVCKGGKPSPSHCSSCKEQAGHFGSCFTYILSFHLLIN